MRIEDVKIGMLVKANGEINGCGNRYVTPNDYGVVTMVWSPKNEVEVKWNNPLVKVNNVCDWWTNPSDIEPAYKKSEIVGGYLKILRNNRLPIGEIYEIVQGKYYVQLETIEEGNLFVWYDKIPDVFTQNDLLGLYGGTTDFRYIPKEEYDSNIAHESKPSPKFTFPSRHQAKEIYEEYTAMLNALMASNPMLTEQDFIERTGYATSAVIRQIMVELEVSSDEYFDLLLDAIDGGLEFGEIKFDSVGKDK